MIDKGYAIYGGTFDPVHIGHLQSALELRKQLGVGHISLIPAANPPHREAPRASAQQRAIMLKLAVKGIPALQVDCREIRRQGKSYTLDTLAELRGEIGSQAPLFLVLGVDAFQLLHQWHQWQVLTHFCHLIIIDRPGYHLNNLQSEVLHWFTSKQVLNLNNLEHEAQGKIIRLRLTQFNVSATMLRERLKNQQPIDEWVPSAVQEYIKEQGLYRK